MPCGKALLELGHLRAHRVRDRRSRCCRGAGRSESRPRCGCRASRAARSCPSRARRARRRAGARSGRLVAGLDDDVLEILSSTRRPLVLIASWKFGARWRRRRRAELAGRDLHVLLANRVDDVARGQAARGDLLRIEPDAHRVVAAAELLHVADAVEARQLVLDVQRDEVRRGRSGRSDHRAR